METVRAIFENGVFRPLTPPELPEHCEVVFVPWVVPAQEIADPPSARSGLIGLLKDRDDIVEDILAVMKERRERPLRTEDV
jgi:predicted DNA-binding antitoxin AbrB/MazE fold protein